MVDLGCGSGALFGQWAAAGAFVCGVDQSGDGLGASQVPEVVVEVDAVQAQEADALAVYGADAPQSDDMSDDLGMGQQGSR
ncbi:hypothetical protein [Streptomyces sp. NBC_00118]|uniref:hypothetical protein n=1 Tax=unclassified Streptomyces TaxID=2593676 RepID=UPI003089C360|nr:class I SAM-dependent methyltransferase [Streptomyces sp. NBC_01397]